jgi:uncharacterized protein (TIGR02391 family)
VGPILNRAFLGRDSLHPLLQKSVCDDFAAGRYDSAVREAFVIVENRIRTASGNKDDTGVKLMRAALNPKGGPQTLTDMSLPLAERQRRVDLFIGAIATFKDPVSQRILAARGPRSVVEVLMFASELLSYLP